MDVKGHSVWQLPGDSSDQSVLGVVGTTLLVLSWHSDPRGKTKALSGLMSP